MFSHPIFARLSSDPFGRGQTWWITIFMTNSILIAEMTELTAVSKYL